MSTSKMKTQPAETRVSNQTARKPVLPLLRPKADVFHTDTELQLVIDLPGVAESELEIELENRVLAVRAEARVNAGEGMEWLHREFRGRRYERRFNLSDRVDVQQIKASFKHGILAIEMPFHADVLSRKIAVTAE